jgi:hypothetical protein
MARPPLSPEQIAERKEIQRERSRLLAEARRDKGVEKKNLKAIQKRAQKEYKERAEEKKGRMFVANGDPGFKIWRTIALNV